MDELKNMISCWLNQDMPSEFESVLDAVTDGIKNSKYEKIIQEVDEIIESDRIVDEIFLEDLYISLLDIN